MTASYLWQRLGHFLASEDGPTAVEYSVMLMLIVTVCLGSIIFIGTVTNEAFDSLEESIFSDVGP